MHDRGAVRHCRRTSVLARRKRACVRRPPHGPARRTGGRRQLPVVPARRTAHPPHRQRARVHPQRAQPRPGHHRRAADRRPRRRGRPAPPLRRARPGRVVGSGRARLRARRRDLGRAARPGPASAHRRDRPGVHAGRPHRRVRPRGLDLERAESRRPPAPPRPRERSGRLSGRTSPRLRRCRWARLRGRDPRARRPGAAGGARPGPRLAATSPASARPLPDRRRCHCRRPGRRGGADHEPGRRLGAVERLPGGHRRPHPAGPAGRRGDHAADLSQAGRPLRRPGHDDGRAIGKVHERRHDR